MVTDVAKVVWAGIFILKREFLALYTCQSITQWITPTLDWDRQIRREETSFWVEHLFFLLYFKFQSSYLKPVALMVVVGGVGESESPVELYYCGVPITSRGYKGVYTNLLFFLFFP